MLLSVLLSVFALICDLVVWVMPDNPARSVFMWTAVGCSTISVCIWILVTHRFINQHLQRSTK